MKFSLWKLAGGVVLLAVLAAAWQHLDEVRRIAWLVAAGCAAVWLVLWLYWIGVLPQKGKIMSLLNKYTRKDQYLSMRQSTVATEVIDVDELVAKLTSQVIGQDPVCRAVAEEVSLHLKKVKRSKPLAVAFTGPKASGKTTLAEALAKSLGRPIKVFDMTQHQTEDKMNDLFGVGRGVVGQDQLGNLHQAIRDYPNAIIFFDEADKGHPKIYQGLLRALDRGELEGNVRGKQMTFSTVNNIFVLASNACADSGPKLKAEYGHNIDLLSDHVKKAMETEMGLSPEFLSRLNYCFIMDKIDGDEDLGNIGILKVLACVKEYGVVLAEDEDAIDPRVLDWIADFQKNSDNARDLARMLDRKLSGDLSEAYRQGAETVRITWVEHEDRPSVEVATWKQAGAQTQVSLNTQTYLNAGGK